MMACQDVRNLWAALGRHAPPYGDAGVLALEHSGRNASAERVLNSNQDVHCEGASGVKQVPLQVTLAAAGVGGGLHGDRVRRLVGGSDAPVSQDQGTE